MQYRGFIASPTVGVPQGLAVYQNGVRVNEAFGDTVNWDFIPEYAIKRLDVLPSNPIFGLNALGGAISIEMKNGFNYQGRELELMGGSFGRRSVIGSGRHAAGQYLVLCGADALNDNGWRDTLAVRAAADPCRCRRPRRASEFHVNFTGASNFFGATAAAPIELLNQRWSAVYTTPQTYKNQLAFLNTTGSYQISDTLSIKGNLYYRGFWQKHDDGNTSDVVRCDPALFPGFLCFEENDDLLFGLTGPVPDFLNGGTAGHRSIRPRRPRTASAARCRRRHTAQLFGLNNNFIVGSSLDRGRVQFKASSELGTIGPDLFVTGTGCHHCPAGRIRRAGQPQDREYIFRTVPDRHGRPDVTAVGHRRRPLQSGADQARDQLGTALNGSHQFMRFNPVVGATYKITPQLNAYASYSEANRAPTPAELACADPERPCLIDNFLGRRSAAEAGGDAHLRGRPTRPRRPRCRRTAASPGIWARSIPLPRTTSSTSPVAITGRGFFQNAATTLRRGIEASATYRSDRWNVYVSYNYIEATFQDVLTLHRPATRLPWMG